MSLPHTPRIEARLIEVEAIRRAAMTPDSFINDDATPAQVRDVRLSLAARYDALVAKYGLDTHALLVQTIQAEYR